MVQFIVASVLQVYSGVDVKLIARISKLRSFYGQIQPNGQ